MKHLFMRMPFLIALLAAGVSSSARADLVDFSYQWTTAPSTVASGTGLVSITPEPKGTGQFDTVAGTAAFIPSVAITTTSSATSVPDVYPGPDGGKFQLSLLLKDTASGQSGTLTFSGLVSGSLSQTVNTLTATFSSPLTQTLMLGGHQYSVAMDSFANLPAPGATANVFLSAGVSITNGNGTPTPPVPPPSPPPTVHTPEPSSLVLGGMALVGLAARRWKASRRPTL